MSSDKSEVQFGNYLTEMPWLALPFGQRELVKTLSKMFGVNGIPALILLDGDTGEVISKNGRSASLTCCRVVVVVVACSKQDGAGSYVWRQSAPAPLPQGKGRQGLERKARHESGMLEALALLGRSSSSSQDRLIHECADLVTPRVV
jgi:hypothetical protein